MYLTEAGVCSKYIASNIEVVRTRQTIDPSKRPKHVYLGPSNRLTMAQLELYELPGCPHCESVRNALAASGLEYDSTTVPRSHGKREELAEISGQTCVPVLVDHESDHTRTPQDGDVATYVETAFGETQVASE